MQISPSAEVTTTLPQVLLNRLRRLSSGGVDRWLDRTVNVALIATAVVVLIAAYQPQSRRVPMPDYSPGAKIDMTKLGASGPALIAVTRSTCGACTASLPFYRTLDHGSLVAVADEPVDTNRKYLTDNGINPRTTISASESGLRVAAVPTLIAVDADGRVIEAWRGKLTPEQERDVSRRVKGLRR